MKVIVISILKFLRYLFQKFVDTPLRLIINESRQERRLEIGSGGGRIPGFETLDIISRWNVDYILDASKALPFKDNTFRLIYSSHTLEHIPWYLTEETLKEWARVLAPGGRLEIWVPDGLKICKAFVDAELHGNNYIEDDGWFKFNEAKDPCKWASGRIFTYGDGTTNISHPNWHRALFSERYLMCLLEQIGLKEVRRLDPVEVRGFDHEWINLGISGIKG